MYTLGLTSLLAQEDHYDVAQQRIWPLVETQLAQSGTDSTYDFILLLVKGHCGNDPDCLYGSYHGIAKKLESSYNLPATIFVTEARLESAELQGNLANMARTHDDLYRYHDALGDRSEAFRHLDASLAIFEKIGDVNAIFKGRFNKLEHSLAYRDLGEVIDEMNVLLEEAVQAGADKTITRIHRRMVYLTKSDQRFDEMLTHIQAIEQWADTTTSSDDLQNGYLKTAYFGRAELAMLENNFLEAEKFFNKVILLCKVTPDVWTEINAMHRLAELYRDHGNMAMAKNYLESAFNQASKREVHDLLSTNYGIRATVAESEGRFKDALYYTRKSQYHKEKWKERGAGFEMRSHYLKLEKEQLAAEKKNQALAIKLKNAQLMSFGIGLVLTLILAGGFIFAYINLRKRKKALITQNAVIQEQTERLSSLDAAKSRFFANVSHELRTPLTLLMGPINSVLKGNQLSEKQNRLLHMARQSGKQLEQLVTEILDLSKLEMGKMEIQPKPTALRTYYLNYFSQFESLALRKNIDYSFRIDIRAEAVALIDRAKCRQLLYNLLSNAFKFTPSGGKVNAKVGLENGMLNLRVTDTGPGIPKEDIPHLFDRYFQTNRPEKPAEGGTGIGLALCHEYVQLFGGQIKVESELGKGSTFMIEVPVELHDGPAEAISGLQDSVSFEATEPVDVQPHASSPLMANGNKKAKPTIMVVEDNPELQDYIRTILESNYEVITADNGGIAWDMLSDPDSSTPYLILSDLMMPVMDGYQLLSRIKSSDHTRHLPVIMLTARADASDKLRALRIGVDDYLLKPFDEEELLVRIQNLLDNHALRQKE